MNQITYQEPFALFARWFDDAKAKEPSAPEAMSLATASADGAPSVRMVLLKGVDDRGFVFFTNYDSRKGGELFANPQAALNFHWKSVARQVRVEGRAETVSDAEADAYFASRPRQSQVAAWASQQSRMVESRAILERRLAEFEARFAGGAVPRPPRWSGFRVVPARIEFWEERPFRLHERLVYVRNGDAWQTELLYP